MPLLSAFLLTTLAGQVSEGNRYLNETQAAAAAPEAAPQAAESGQTDPPAGASGSSAAPNDQVNRQGGQVSQQKETAQVGPSFGSRSQTPPRSGSPAASEPQKSVVISLGPKPSELMRNILKPPVNNQLTGVELTLSEAVRDAKTRQDQTQRAKAYWDLSAAVADYYLAQLEEMELSVLRQGLRTPGKAWDARQREAQSRSDIARRAAQAAQLRLHYLLSRPANAALPLPGDVPHCGRYNTEYEEIFASRPNEVAQQLSKLMPLRYNDLRWQAQSVAEAEAGRNAVRERLDPNADGTELLQAQDLLALRRRTFVATARDYNQEIAAYTELAAPADVPADRLVAMMIRTSAPVGEAPWNSSGVEQASALEPVPQAGSDAQQAGGESQGRSHTFAGGQQREVRHSGPLQRLFNRDREHSILVDRPRLLRRVLGNQ